MDADRRSLGELFSDLTSQLSTLIRQELELARTEMTSNAQRAGRNAALIGAGAAVGYAAFLVLVAAAVALLATLGLDTWLAALVVAIVLGVIAAALIQRGRAALAAANLAPTRTIATLKDDAELAKERAR